MFFLLFELLHYLHSEPWLRKSFRFWSPDICRPLHELPDLDNRATHQFCWAFRILCQTASSLISVCLAIPEPMPVSVSLDL